MVPGDKHLNLEDLAHLPNPSKELCTQLKPRPMTLNCLDEKESIFRYVSKKDLMLHFPYHSFEHFIHFLYEAVHDPSCKEIMITQYRVAENSVVINTLIAAAQNGKKVTVFVELKARFDEENNLATAEMMKRAGIHIIFSIPGLKVHAKVALVLRYNKEGKQTRSYAYISTGNFNEKTARIYADSGLFTSNEIIVNDLYTLFRVLQKEVTEPKFKRLLVARFNLLPELRRRIGYEINMAKAGKEARIILKMNALQDPAMIDELYKASEAGVKIDLIVRRIIGYHQDTRSTLYFLQILTESSNLQLGRRTRFQDTFLQLDPQSRIKHLQIKNFQIRFSYILNNNRICFLFIAFQFSHLQLFGRKMNGRRIQAFLLADMREIRQ